MTEQRLSPDTKLVLKPCPFCGSEAAFERHGSSRQSSIVACQECGCRVETGETWNEGQLWNTRAGHAQIPPSTDAMELAGLPWRIDEDSTERIVVKNDRGEIVHQTEYSDIPTERGAAFVEQTVKLERAFAYAMVRSPGGRPAQSPLMEATQAQHVGLPKGEPAKFVRSGKLETCQCRDCRDLAQSLPSHWAIEESTPNDGFECYFLLRDGITVGEFSGRQTDQRSRHLRDLVDAANKGAPVSSTVRDTRPDWQRAKDPCLTCGRSKADHSYNGDAYGVCGKYVAVTRPNRGSTE